MDLRLTQLVTWISEIEKRKSNRMAKIDAKSFVINARGKQYTQMKQPYKQM